MDWSPRMPPGVFTFGSRDSRVSTGAARCDDAAAVAAADASANGGRVKFGIGNFFAGVSKESPPAFDVGGGVVACNEFPPASLVGGGVSEM